METKTVHNENRLQERKRLANEIRNTINWIAVFETEYQLPKEVVEQLRLRLIAMTERLEHI